MATLINTVNTDFLKEISAFSSMISNLSEVKQKELITYIRNFVFANGENNKQGQSPKENSSFREETTVLIPMKDDENFVAVAKHFGAKIVRDENNAEYVLFFSKDYQAFSSLIEKIEDEEDEKLAEERTKNFDSNTCISAEELYKKYGFTEKDLEGFEDVELE